jgi:acetyltransferase-like isoleucine patch superfamily enzyme
VGVEKVANCLRKRYTLFFSTRNFESTVLCLADLFFDLSEFAHKELFHKDLCIDNPLLPVWQALDQLSAYFKQIPLGQIDIDIPTHAHFVNPELISIGKGTVIEPGAYIQGPAIIGANCQIRQGAYIRGSLVAGDGCVIGHDTEVKNSILLNRAVAAHFAYVGDSILGNRCNLGAGVKCANLKLDKGPISLKVGETRVETHRRKLGLILGDFGQVGCNAVTNPGTLLAPHSICYPSLNIGGVFLKKTHLKPAASPFRSIEF